MTKRTTTGQKPADDRRERFVALYLADKTRNAGACYVKAGYSPKGANAGASRLLSDVNIRAQIDAALKPELAELEVTAKRVIAELAAIGFANMLDYVDADGGVALSRLTRQQGAAIKKLRIDDRIVGDETSQVVLRTTQLELGDKRAALVDLGRYLGIFKEDAAPQQDVRFIVIGHPKYAQLVINAGAELEQETP